MKSLFLLFILCGITNAEEPAKNGESPTEINWLVERIKVDWPKESSVENEADAEQESISATTTGLKKLENQLELDLSELNQQNEPNHISDQENQNEEDKIKVLLKQLIQGQKEQPNTPSHSASDEREEQAKPKQTQLKNPQDPNEASNIGRNKKDDRDEIMFGQSEDNSDTDGLDWSRIYVDDSEEISKGEKGGHIDGNAEDLREKEKDKPAEPEDYKISLEEAISQEVGKSDEHGLDIDLDINKEKTGQGRIGSATKAEEGSWERDAGDISWTFDILKDSIKASDILLAREGPGSIVRAADGNGDSVADWKKVSWSKENEKEKKRRK